VGVFWRHRHQLPLSPGDVVYRVDGRAMEITLETTATSESEETLSGPEDEEVTDDGLRVVRLAGQGQLLTPGDMRPARRNRGEQAGQFDAAVRHAAVR
jgi:hypothetical protein